MAQFTDLLTLPALHDFVREAGFQHPTAVQSAAIPRLLAGRSVSVLAQTGSGKTLAYALPIVELLKQQESAAPESAPPPGAPRAWVVCPTRELGAQIEKVFKSLAHWAKLRVRHLKGAANNQQSRAVAAAPIDVLISSPNRALAALRGHELRTDATRILIFDEADQLFDRSFLADVQGLVAGLRSRDPQVGLFSATMPPTFGELRERSFPGVEFDELTLQGSHRLRSNIATDNYTVPYKEKVEQSVRLLKKTQGPGLVFVNQKSTAEEVFGQLTKALPRKKVQMLHGGLEKRERRKVLTQFADGGEVLVCTDVAARGLHLEGMTWLLNYDLPFEAVYYVHRCGRIGRAGEPARVFNLVTTKDRALINRINTAIANQASLKLSRVAARLPTTGAGAAANRGAGRGAERASRGGKPRKREPRADRGRERDFRGETFVGAKSAGERERRSGTKPTHRKSPSRSGRKRR